MASIERVIVEHREITALAEALRAAALAEAPGSGHIHAAADALAAALQAHYDYMRTVFYPVVARYVGQIFEADRAEDFAAELRALLADWEAYRGHWTLEAGAAAPLCHAAESAVIAERIGLRIARENGCMLENALKVPGIRLRRDRAA